MARSKNSSAKRLAHFRRKYECAAKELRLTFLEEVCSDTRLKKKDILTFVCVVQERGDEYDPKTIAKLKKMFPHYAAFVEKDHKEMQVTFQKELDGESEEYRLAEQVGEELFLRQLDQFGYKG